MPRGHKNFHCGGGEIRTHDTLLGYTAFRVRRFRPLSHPTKLEIKFFLNPLSFVPFLELLFKQQSFLFCLARCLFQKNKWSAGFSGAYLTSIMLSKSSHNIIGLPNIHFFILQAFENINEKHICFVFGPCLPCLPAGRRQAGLSHPTVLHQFASTSLRFQPSN